MLRHSSLPDAGRISHDEIDDRLPTQSEIQDLRDLTSGILELQVSLADVTNPPTDAELDAEFGTPATVGAGFVALLNDNGGGTNIYLIASDGTNWLTNLFVVAS